MAKNKAKETKKQGGLSRLLKLAVAVAAVYLAVSFITGQIQVTAKQRQLEELEAKVAQQAEKNAELERLMESGNEDAYIERIAREKLRYARPDEHIYIDTSEEE